MQVDYPIVFRQTADGYEVEVPDLDIRTRGGDRAEAIQNVADVVGMRCTGLQDDNIALPTASTPAAMRKRYPNWEGEHVNVDLDEYRQKYSTKKQ